MQDRTCGTQGNGAGSRHSAEAELRRAKLSLKKKWELAADPIDQARGWGLPDRIVLGDAGYGEATEFRDALEEHGLRYAVGIAPI